jgi:thioredoxin 1
MENVIIGTKDNVSSLIANGKTTLVDFTASWCGPCKMLGPILDKLAEENPELQIIKVDVDENNELSAEYSVRSVPMVFIYKDGAQVGKFVGPRSKEEILKLIA